MNEVNAFDIYAILIIISEIVKDIVKNCQFMTCKRDHVIIKQGDKGDW